MWNPFRRSREGALKGHVDGLSELVRDHEGRLKALETEWSSVYAKITKTLGHITKSAAIEAARTADTQTRSTPVEQLTREQIAQLHIR